ncbi:MFS transporter [Gottfriedia sp. NPDC056225]|uniref:MFS transporter n=1 Tax=Gottfriedia sp. NPDC056225 TaxID=3345751 RepID=UPI0015588F24|nr:MFS transporter [Arthrobacter citreus]
MLQIFKSFSTELKFYLLMNTFFSFGGALSGIFQSVFLWKLDKTYSLLARFSLHWSVAIILCFGICAWIARKTSPMITMRLGFICYLITYLIMLFYHANLNEHILLLGFLNGLAMSLYYVGVHLAILDLTTNEQRDKFLYVQGILMTIGGVIAPLLSGVIISQFNGMKGYYVVFTGTCIFFFIAFLTSLKVKGKPVSSKSHFWDVVKKPSPEWKKMYLVMFSDGVVSGVYTTFLITMMTFKVAGGELNLGIYNTFAQLVAVCAFYFLAKLTNQNDRIKIFAVGAIGILLSSILISSLPYLISLIIFGIVSPVAMNMINTSMNAMIYESIERDPNYKNKRLDYIIIREIPLGIGRIIGVFIFLALGKYFNLEALLPISFSFFPIIYVVMIPILYLIWKKPLSKSVLQSKEV